MIRTVNLTTPAPPDGTTFAAVQIEATADGETWRIVGAESARDVRYGENEKGERVIVSDTLKPQIAARCKLTPGDRLIRCLWVCEDSSYGIVETGPHAPGEQPRRRR